MVTVITDARVYNVNQSYYASEGFSRILERYSKGFGKIVLITRIIKTKQKPKNYRKIDDYCKGLHNAKSIASTAFLSSKEIKETIKNSDFVIIRLPSLISMFLYKYVKRYHKKYMAEAMGCAWDAFWNHGLLGKIVAPYGFFKMKHIIRTANYAVYVTNRFLQERYPCSNRSIGISNVNITNVCKQRHYDLVKHDNFSFLTAAAVDVRYKGQQYMMKAIKILKQQGMNCDYYLAGGGDNSYLSEVAKKNDVENNIHFLGSVQHDELLTIMQNVDFYVQPSLQEGLPRSVIEAMSCGLVCFGSNTAGIPELLDDDQVFLRRNVKSIVRTISNTISNDNLDAISGRNINTSKNYTSTVLDKRRFAFYKSIVNELGMEQNE